MAEHYFTDNPSSAELRQPVSARVWGHDLRLQSATGVFAAGRLDRGTAVLFREAAPPATPGVFLDLGCGYGVIACALAIAVPGAEVWALDVNERALRLCQDNAATLGVGERVHAVTAEQLPVDLRFDEIWSNPPIHIGKPALHELLGSRLGRLSPKGRAVLVVGKNLGADSLQRWVNERGELRCVRIGSAKGFRVLEIRRTGSPGQGSLESGDDAAHDPATGPE
jgi:16S rRNA (guanine1207-N2)-methyltransferase